MPPDTYTGRIAGMRITNYPGRRRPVVRGQIKADHRFRMLPFEIYTAPGESLKMGDRVLFELDRSGGPINIRRQKFT